MWYYSYYSNTSRNQSGSATDGETREARKLTSSRSPNGRCLAYVVDGEANESSCKVVALCVNVVVAEREDREERWEFGCF